MLTHLKQNLKWEKATKELKEEKLLLELPAKPDLAKKLKLLKKTNT